MGQATLFDAAESEAAKATGMAQAAAARADLLALARRIAIELALANPDRETNADAVQMRMLSLGYDPEDLGPAAGSIFKTGEWEFTGRRVNSARVKNHARELKVWRLNS